MIYLHRHIWLSTLRTYLLSRVRKQDTRIMWGAIGKSTDRHSVLEGVGEWTDGRCQICCRRMDGYGKLWGKWRRCWESGNLCWRIRQRTRNLERTSSIGWGSILNSPVELICSIQQLDFGTPPPFLKPTPYGNNFWLLAIAVINKLNIAQLSVLGIKANNSISDWPK